MRQTSASHSTAQSQSRARARPKHNLNLNHSNIISTQGKVRIDYPGTVQYGIRLRVLYGTVGTTLTRIPVRVYPGIQYQTTETREAYSMLP
jgi:hypothetical protein